MINVAFTREGRAHSYSIKRFEELFQIQYLSHLEYANWEVERLIPKYCKRAERHDRISALSLWLGHLHGKELDRAAIPPITIRWIHEKIGYGIFADAPISPWQFVGEYTGLLRRRRLLFPDVNDYCFMYPRKWLSTKVFTIDSKGHGNFTRFINHSDTPNLESLCVFHRGVFRVILRACEAIPAGSELTYDYGDVYWLERKKLPPNSF